MMTKPSAVRGEPGRWRRAVWMAGLFVVALAGWTLYLIQMDATVFNDPEASEMQKWTTWVGVPLAGLLLVLLSQWGLTAFATSRGEANAEAPREVLREVVLEADRRAGRVDRAERRVVGLDADDQGAAPLDLFQTFAMAQCGL